MHKVRVYMGKRDAFYKLTDMIEFDEGFIGVATPGRVKDQLKSGKGSRRKAEVSVSAESFPLEDLDTGKTSRSCGYFKLEVLGKVDGDHVKQFIKKNAEGGIVLFTDKNTAYSQLKDVVEANFTVVS